MTPITSLALASHSPGASGAGAEEVPPQEERRAAHAAAASAALIVRICPGHYAEVPCLPRARQPLTCTARVKGHSFLGSAVVVEVASREIWCGA